MFESIKQFLVEQLDVKAEDITMETTLAGDLGINSIDLFDFLEDLCGILVELLEVFFVCFIY